MNKDDAFEVSYGLVISNPDTGEDAPLLVGGTSSPLGQQADIGTLYFQDTPTGLQMWEKVDTTAQDWVKRYFKSTNSSTIDNIFTVKFTRNSSVKNKWLETGDGCTSDETWVVLPFACQLIATSVANSKVGADFDLRIYKSDFNAGNNMSFNLWNLPNNVRIATKNNWDIQYAAGTKLGIYAVDKGTDAKDVTFVMWLKITNDDVFEDQENFSGDFDFDEDDDDDD